uniref:Uncharacterized protein n=1 Tax=Globisporangium ultimum (strain ATCC 200006 / CBS 805.95 / DAOM BR144) TaxID=431595 RepID=K3WK31_GLOUD
MARRGRPKGCVRASADYGAERKAHHSKKASAGGAKAAPSSATRASEASSAPRRSPRKIDEAASAVVAESSTVTVVESSTMVVVLKQSTPSSSGNKLSPASSRVRESQGKSASMPHKLSSEVETSVGEEVESVAELTAPPVPSSRRLQYDEDDDIAEEEQATAFDASSRQNSQRGENDEVAEEEQAAAPEVTLKQELQHDVNEEVEEAEEDVAASEDSPESSEYEPSANESATQDVGSEDGESGNVQIAAAATLPDGIKPRRKTVFWSEEEEECLRKGIEMYGLGKWRMILDSGAGIFSKHRTNVDLKDKWKNLQLGKEKRKRAPQGFPRPESDPEASVTFAAAPRRKKQRTAAAVATASFAAVRNAEGSQSPNEPHHRSELKASGSAHARPIEDNYFEIDDDEDDEDDEEEQRTQESEHNAHEPDGQEEVERDAESADATTTREGVQALPKANDRDFVKLKFVTDKSYPRRRVIHVNLRQCKKVATLKEFVRKYIVFAESTATDLQLVGIQSRRLIDDHEDLKSCVERFGNSYYVVC